MTMLAKLVELYIDLRRSSEEHVPVCMGLLSHPHKSFSRICIPSSEEDEEVLNREELLFAVDNIKDESAENAGLLHEKTKNVEAGLLYPWFDILFGLNSDIGWSQSLKDPNNELESSLANQSCIKLGPKRQIGNDPLIKRQQSAIMDREQENRKLSQPSPEDLVL
ncbi:hypothetical protein LguiB_020078 [Lonicera macranthoides]